MEYEKLEYQLRLIALLTEGRFLNVPQIAEAIGIGRRTVYRHLESLPLLGLPIEKRGTRYRIAPEAPFLDRIASHIRLSVSEAAALRQVLQGVGEQTPLVRQLRDKLSRIGGDESLMPINVDETTARNIRTVFEAIRLEQCVWLKGYASPHSGAKSNRLVEAFAFLPGNREVRCYEMTSGMNKTFSLARVEEVVMVDVRWNHKQEHRPLITDLFHFSSESSTPLTLRLGLLAKSVLLDEYPQAATLLTPDPDSPTWTLRIEVCSYKGIGRFVLGLLDDIEVVDNEAFTHYLQERIASFTARLHNSPTLLSLQPQR